MGTAQNPALREAIAGALEWWREAGVDCAFGDDPVDWLAQVADVPVTPEKTRPTGANQPPSTSAAAPLAPVTPAAPRLDPALLPGSLDAFASWWLEEPLLADGPPASRIPPRGKAGADLMVIVPEPEREDRTELLSGPQGTLLAAMLSAFGLAGEQVYFASALPRHLPGADWDSLAPSGLGAALLRHVALVQPKRVIVFGTTVLPLIGHAPSHGPADLRIFNHEGTNVPLLACRSLAALLEQPRWKARVWQAWLELTA